MFALSAFIRSVGSYFPEQVVTNYDLSPKLETSHEWIYSHTGVVKRHIADETVAASDLGRQAALHALQQGNLAPSEIDFLLVSTSTPDYSGGLPSTACIIQDAVGLRNIPAMDIAAACSGFIYALETARCFIEAGAAHNILIVCTEKYSSVLNWNDRSTCVLFGDGAAAVIVSEAHDTASTIMPMSISTDGSKASYLMRPAGGSRKPIVEDTAREDMYLQMNGRQVYNYAVSSIISLIETTLAEHNLHIDDIKYIVPHQANARMIDAVAKRMQLPREKFFTNIADRANTASASIPACLSDMHDGGEVQQGDKLILISFGAGLTSGGGLIIW